MAMSHALPRVSLALTALAFGVFGAITLVYPDFITLTGVELPTPSARTEVRGFYGGMELGFAAFFAVAALRPDWFRAGLVAQVLAFWGMAAGRVFGVLIDGSPISLMFLLIALETLGGLVGLVVLLILRRRAGEAAAAPVS